MPIDDFNGLLSFYSERPTPYENIALCAALTQYTIYKTSAGKKGTSKFEDFIPKYIYPKEEDKQDNLNPTEYFLQYCNKNKGIFQNG